MRKLLIAITSCILALSISTAGAQPLDVTVDEQVDTTKALELTLNGTTGGWLPEDMHRQIQADIEAYREQNKYVLLLEQHNKIKNERVTLLKESLDLQREVADEYKKGFTTAIRAQRVAEDKKNSIFSGQPGIWVLVGAVASALVIAVLK